MLWWLKFGFRIIKMWDLKVFSACVESRTALWLWINKQIAITGLVFYSSRRNVLCHLVDGEIRNFFRKDFYESGSFGSFTNSWLPYDLFVKLRQLTTGALIFLMPIPCWGHFCSIFIPRVQATMLNQGFKFFHLPSWIVFVNPDRLPNLRNVMIGSSGLFCRSRILKIVTLLLKTFENLIRFEQFFFLHVILAVSFSSLFVSVAKLRVLEKLPV